MPKAEFKRINEEREEAGLPLYANPRNSGAGLAPPDRPDGHRAVASCRPGSTSWSRTATRSPPRRPRSSGWPPSASRSTRTTSRARHRRRHRLHRALARGAPRPPVRDRRRRRQGRPVRPAGAARDGQPGAALGDRLQVPARAGRGVHRGHRPVRRADGDADAGRAHDAGQGRRARRSRGRPSTTSTRSGARTSGSATGSSSRRPATSSPRSSGRSSSGGPAPSASSRCRRRCPVCDTPVVQDEGAVRVYCPNPRCPARLSAGVRSFRGARRDGHRGRRLEGPRPAPRARAGQHAGRLLPADASRTSNRSTGSRARAPRTCTPRSRTRRPTAGAGHQRARHPAGRRARPRSTSPAG